MVRITERIYIGNYEDSKDTSGFHAVVSITKHPVNHAGPHFHYKRGDGRPWDRGEQKGLVRFVQDHIAGGKILFHCDAGISRSSAAVVRWLMACGFGKDEAVRFVKGRHEGANPSQAILDSFP